MDNKAVNNLTELINQKINLLNDYDSITYRLLIDDPERLSILLDSRQEIIEKADSIDAAIDAIVNLQSSEIKNSLRELLKFKNNGEICNEQLVEIKSHIVKLKEVLDSIMAKETKLSVRLQNLKLELDEDMKKINKGKKVIEYVDSTSNSNVFNGSNLDMNS